MPSDGMMALSAACLALALCGGLLTLRSAVPAARHLLVIFACLAGLTSFPLIASLNRELAIWHLPVLLPLLLGLSPAVFVYVRARTAALDANASSDLSRHGVLPGLGAVIAVAVLALPEAARLMIVGEGVLPPGWFARGLVLIAFILIITAPLVSLGYLWASVKRLRRHRVWLKERLSNLDKRELRWVDGLITSFVALWAAAGLALLSDNLAGRLWVSGEAVMAVAAAALMVILAFALSPEPDLQMDPASATDSSASVREKYERSALSPAGADALAQKIDAAMRDDALYLDANLSLDKLARQVRGAPDHVSQTLNAHMETTFFDYVAAWRVSAAQRLLVEGKKSVLEIAIEVGFNSRSTFYKAFKRETGLTPSAYRAQQAARPG
jgi:AraC-like DNA-binding protein